MEGGRETGEKNPNRFVAKIVMYFTICKGRISDDANASTSSTERYKITARENQESLRSPVIARSPITIAAAAANTSVWLWTIGNSSFS